MTSDLPQKARRFDALHRAGITYSRGLADAEAALGLVRRAAEEIRGQGRFGYAAEQIPDAELCRLFSTRGRMP